MAKKITITCDNILISAAIRGIIDKAFNIYSREVEHNPKQLSTDGYDAERACIPALEAVINSVISPKLYSITQEEVEEPQEE